MLRGKRARRPVKGWGPLRCEWYSFCSVHYFHDEACSMCTAGAWVNVPLHRLDALVWAHARPVALWWHNRPNSKARRLIGQHFPRLR